MKKKRLVVLDVDHTLMEVEPFLGLSLDELQSQHPKSFQFDKYNYACPRPYLDHFVEWLSQRDDIEVAIFSSASREYLDKTIKTFSPKLFESALFIWDGASEFYYRANAINLKDLNGIKDNYGYELEDIIMIDDNSNIKPELCWLKIEAFSAHRCFLNKENDKELIRALLSLEKILLIDNIHEQYETDDRLILEALNKGSEQAKKEGFDSYESCLNSNYPTPCEYVDDDEVESYLKNLNPTRKL